MKRINFVGIFIILFLLVNISLVITQNGLTEDQLKILRDKGLEITESTKIGDRIFTPIEGKGFVKKVSDGIFLARNVKINTGQNDDKDLDKIEIVIPGVDTHVIFKDGDYSELDEEKNYIQIVGKERYKEITINGKKFNVKYDEKNLPKFVLDKKGNLDKGTEFQTKEGEYNLRGYKIKLPENSKVKYLEDKVVVTVPKDSEIKNPSIEGKLEGVIEIKTDGKYFLKIPQGNVGAVEESNGAYTLKEETSLFYGPGRKDEIRMYTKEKYTTFFTENGMKQEFTIINLKEDELDLVFDNKKVDAKRSSVLVTKDEIGSINLEGEGAIISIASDNRLGIGKGQLEAGKKTLSYQGKKGYAVLGKGLGGDNPLIRLQGASLYGPDNRVFLGDADRKEFYYKPNKVIEEVKNGNGAIALNVKLYDKDNKPLPYVILTTNENSHLLAPEKDLRGPEKYYVTEGVVYGANAAFNQLTPESRKELIQLGAGERTGFLNQLKGGGDVAAIQTNINKVLLQSNPLRSSVALGGCSGTLIGYSKDGSPMVLTAAHCVRRGGSRNVWLNNLNDGSKADRGVRGIYADVVAYSSRGYQYDETKDLALLKLRPGEQQLAQIEKRGFARISPRKDFVKVNDKVTMIGCPSSTFYSRSCTVLRIDQTTGTDSLRTDLEPYKGQSGGGLFKGRHLVGVVQSGRSGRAQGGFGNLQSIYKLLDDSGYSYLYKIFFVFVFK